jgi:phage replication O-like protein O
MPKGDREILKADPDDGTTPVANLLLSALAISKLSGKEIRAILFIFRRTYGWHTNGTRFKESKMPFEEWREALSMGDAHVSTLLTGLENKGIIKRRHLLRGSKEVRGYYYSINTQVSEWNNTSLNPQQLRKIESYGKPQQFPNSEMKHLPKKETVSLPKKGSIPDTNLATSKSILNKSKESNRYRDNKKGLRRPQDNTDPDKYIKGRYGHMVGR